MLGTIIITKGEHTTPTTMASMTNATKRIQNPA
jgi:hypothetical protein